MCNLKLLTGAFRTPLPNTEEHDHAEDECENAHQVHAPHDLGIHERLAREASIPLLLIVVVERGAKENALAGTRSSLGNLEPGNLHQHGASFGDDDNADDGEEEPGLHENEHDTDGGSEAHGTGVTHVDFCRRAVEPQISEQRASDRGREREELIATRKVRDAQVLTKDKVSAHVGHKSDKHHAGKNRHRNEAIETVCEVRSVR